MKVLFAGNYEQDYNRTLILLNGLKGAGSSVVEFPFVKKNKSTGKRIAELSGDADFVFLPSFTHRDVTFVKKWTERPVIFDPLISKYLTKVFDYRSAWRFSFKALRNYMKDKVSMNAADIVIADTHAHKDYYAKTIKVHPDKIKVVPIGVDVDLFYPDSGNRDTSIFKVGFYGSFVPLQGIDLIIKAARQLKKHDDIHFEIIGGGFVEKKIKKDVDRHPIKNLTFRRWVKFTELNQYINGYDLCLGIFGKSKKAQLVIPNKVFHYAACGKCIITLDTPAIREIFKTDENIVLCERSSEDLASKILMVKEEHRYREQIAENAFNHITKKYNEIRVAWMLVDAYDSIKA